MKKFTGFSFHMYTEILFGKNTEFEVARMIRKYGGTKVMLVYGSGSIKKIGLYDTVVKALNGGGISFLELNGVQPNPRRSLVEKGLQTAKKEGVDFLLGVGGGSVIDTAKAIALGLANDGEYWKFYTGTKAEKMMPVGTIPTIAAAGSEASSSSVLLDDIDDYRKYGFMHVVCRPVFSILNPELTYTVPAYQTGAGSVDIFAHTVLRYFTASSSRLGDEYCEGTLRTVVKYAYKAYAHPNDYEARAELILAAAFSHNDVTGIGRADAVRGGEHGLEAQISGTYNTAHGAGLAVVMPAWLQYITNYGTPEQVARIAQFGIKVFGTEPDMCDVKATANDGLNRFRRWIDSIGMPLTLKELGIPKEDLKQIVDNCNCSSDGILHGYMDLDKDAVETIFSSVVG